MVMTAMLHCIFFTLGLFASGSSADQTVLTAVDVPCLIDCCKQMIDYT